MKTMKLRYLKDKYKAWGLIILAGFTVLGVSCKDEDSFEALGSEKIVSEIKLKVTDNLPLLVNTDSLIAYTVFPEDAGNKNLLWTSANEEIASVDAEGRITAHQLGKVYITAMPEVGFADTETFEVEVIDKIIEIQDIHVKNEGQLSVYATASLQLETSFTPEVVTYTTLNWISETPEIATVSEDGLVTGIAPGIARIRIEARDGSLFSKVVMVEVKEVVSLTDILFDESQKELALYETSVLNITPVPENATVSAIEWSSENESVVSIDKVSGVFTVKTYGTTRLTAKCGDVEKSLEVTVVKGKINDTFLYGVSNWEKFGDDAESAEIVDGKLLVKASTSLKKASIHRIPDTDFHAGLYPIVAIKMTKVATTCNLTFDSWTGKDLGGAYAGCNGSYDVWKPQTLTDSSDGIPVFYANLAEHNLGKSKLPVDEAKTLDEYLYRLQNLGTADHISYEVYWVKSFKSVEELKAYIGAE